jgi:hypothetical protein
MIILQSHLEVRTFKRYRNATKKKKEEMHNYYSQSLDQ